MSRTLLFALVLAGCYPAREPWTYHCPEGTVWDGVSCAVLTAPPTNAVADPFVGNFRVSSVSPNGDVASGHAMIATPSGGVYRVTYSLAGVVSEGVGLLHEGVLSVGIGGADSGVAQYGVTGPGRLDGTWVFHGKGQQGTETLTGGNADLSGVYQIQGVGPDGGSYGGTCDLVVTGDLHTLLWHVPNASGGSDTYRGLGLRQGATLSVGFSTAKGNAPFAVVQYRVEGPKRLVGQRASWATTSPTAVTETLVRP